jgi:hypothetical protein
MSVSDDSEEDGTGGGSLQIWRINDLIWRPEKVQCDVHHAHLPSAAFRAGGRVHKASWVAPPVAVGCHQLPQRSSEHHVVPVVCTPAPPFTSSRHLRLARVFWIPLNRRGSTADVMETRDAPHLLLSCPVRVHVFPGSCSGGAVQGEVLNKRSHYALGSFDRRCYPSWKRTVPPSSAPSPARTRSPLLPRLPPPR